jgi:hypothetical protein
MFSTFLFTDRNTIKRQLNVAFGVMVLISTGVTLALCLGLVYVLGPSVRAIYTHMDVVQSYQSCAEGVHTRVHDKYASIHTDR